MHEERTHTSFVPERTARFPKNKCKMNAVGIIFSRKRFHFYVKMIRLGSRLKWHSRYRTCPFMPCWNIWWYRKECQEGMGREATTSTIITTASPYSSPAIIPWVCTCRSITLADSLHMVWDMRWRNITTKMFRKIQKVSKTAAKLFQLSFRPPPPWWRFQFHSHIYVICKDPICLLYWEFLSSEVLQ